MIGMFVPGSRRWRGEPTPEQRAAAGIVAGNWRSRADGGGQKWWVCQVRSDRQLPFLDHCRQIGVEAFTPIMQAQIRCARRRKPVTVMRCIYRGYVFVRQDFVSGGLASGPGWIGFVRSGARLQSVADAAIDGIRQMEVELARMAEEEARRRDDMLRAGARVRLDRGWLEGEMGTVERDQRSRHHVRVVLDIRPEMPIELSPFVLTRM